MNKALFLCGKKNDCINKRQKERQRIDAEIIAVLDHFEDRPERREAFQRLLTRMRSQTELLKPGQRKSGEGWISPVFLIQCLKNLAQRQAHWIRPVETWDSPPGNLRPVFCSLAQHLLTFYQVPGFMDSAWDLNSGPEGFRQQAWYMRLGRGASVRALDVPLPLTRRMEHFVRRAPEHYTIWQALRYGEVRGLGGSERLAREVVIGLLGRKVEHDRFWRTVLHFFAIQPEMPITYVNPIVDFVQANTFGGDGVLTDQGFGAPVPRWPNFSMEGAPSSPCCVWRIGGTWN